MWRGEVQSVTTLRVVLGTRTRGATWCRVLLAGAVSMVGVIGLAPRAAHAAAAPSVAVPAYFWSSTQWDRMLVSSEELRYVVMNPENGPGTVSYPTFVTKVAAARAQGAIVVGYVDTSYGVRPLAAVKADIDKYRMWYGVNAFFFDQTPYDCAKIPYYQEVETYVRAQAGGFIFHNPGMNPQECYLDVADVVVNFEGSEASYHSWTPAPYAPGYPAGRFWHIVYAVDPTHAAALLSNAASRNGGFVFLTEQDMPNPFAVIPTDALWFAQTPTRYGRKAAPQASPPLTAPIPPPSTRMEAPQSSSSTTSASAGASSDAASDAPVAIRPAGVATSTTTTTVAIGSAQSAQVPLATEPVSTTFPPSSTSGPPTVPPTSPPVSPTFLSQRAAVLPAPSVLAVMDAFPITPPAPIVPPVASTENSTVVMASRVRGSEVTSVVMSTTLSPMNTPPPAGPALVSTTPTATKVAVRVATPLATSSRRVAEVPKKTRIARRSSIR